MPSRDSYYVMNSRAVRDLQVYLENARSSQLQAPNGWRSAIDYCHGQNRSASKDTFHIGIWKNSSDGHHYSAIFGGKSRLKLVEGSRIDHGTTEPSLVHVLNAHKRVYHVTPPTSSSSSSDSDNGNGGGGAGRGGGSGGRGQGKPATKKIYRDDYGGYYYFGPNHEWRACDQSGNDIATQRTAFHSRGTSRAANSGYAATPSSSYYTQASTSSAASTQVKYYTDQYGRRYYTDAYGRTQWA